MKRKLILKFLFFFFCVVFLLLSGSVVRAETAILSSFVKGYNEIPIEKLSTFNETSSNLESKTKVVLLPIKPSNLRFNNDCKLWLRSVIYYLNTRLGLKELPVPLAICDDGSVYELTSESYTRTSLISGEKRTVFVLYLDGEGGNIDAVAGSIAKIMAAFSLDIDAIEIRDFVVELNRVEQSMQFKEGEKPLESYNELLENIKSKSFRASSLSGIEIISFSKVSQTTSLGSVVEMKLRLKNISKIDLFDIEDISGGIYLTTINPLDMRSPFYAGEKFWASFSRIPIIEKGNVLKSGEQKDFILRFKYIVGKGEFAITNIRGESYLGTNIKLDFVNNIIEIPGAIGEQKKGEVEILENPAGYINARNLPSLNSSILTKVFPQKKYPLLEISGLWYKIEIEGVSAWISSEYAKITKNLE